MEWHRNGNHATSRPKATSICLSGPTRHGLNLPLHFFYWPHQLRRGGWHDHCFVSREPKCTQALDRRFWIIAFTVTLLTGILRVAAGRHFPTTSLRVRWPDFGGLACEKPSRIRAKSAILEVSATPRSSIGQGLRSRSFIRLFVGTPLHARPRKDMSMGGKSSDSAKPSSHLRRVRTEPERIASRAALAPNPRLQILLPRQRPQGVTTTAIPAKADSRSTRSCPRRCKMDGIFTCRYGRIFRST